MNDQNDHLLKLHKSREKSQKRLKLSEMYKLNSKLL